MVNNNYKARRGRGASFYEKRKEGYNKPVRKLNMRKSEEFNYLLGKLVEPLSDSVKGSIMGSIYAIASKKGVKEAKEFIDRKHSEGVIDAELQKKLIDLVSTYGKVR